jgi:hypothetical protein
MTTDPREKDDEARDATAEPGAHEAQDDGPDVEAHMPKIIKLGADEPQAPADA